MKKSWAILGALVLAIFSSCSSLIEKNEGSLAVTLPGSEARVTFGTDLYWFEVSLEPAVQPAKKAYPGETVYFYDLDSGEYTVTVNAKKDGETVPFFTGSRSAKISGSDNKVPVSIKFNGSESTYAFVKMTKTVYTKNDSSGNYTSTTNEVTYNSLSEAFADMKAGTNDSDTTYKNSYEINVNGNVIVSSELAVPEYANVRIVFNGNATIYLKDFERSDKESLASGCSFFRADKSENSLVIENGLFVCGDQIFDKNLFRTGTDLCLKDVKVSGFNGYTAMVFGGAGTFYAEDCKFYNCNVVYNSSKYFSGDDGENCKNSVFNLRNSSLVLNGTTIENCNCCYGSAVKVYEKSTGNEITISQSYFNDSKIITKKASTFPLVELCGLEDGAPGDITANIINSDFYAPGTVINIGLNADAEFFESSSTFPYFDAGKFVKDTILAGSPETALNINYWSNVETSGQTAIVVEKSGSIHSYALNVGADKIVVKSE